MGLAPVTKKSPSSAPAAASTRTTVQAKAASPGVPLYVQAAAKTARRETARAADDGVGADADGVTRIATGGVSNAADRLPHVDRIQAAFGDHDVSHVRAAVGGDGGAAAQQMGARAYTIGDRVAFREAPDLRLAAHEATHVVQQRGGVQLKDGVGR